MSCLGTVIDGRWFNTCCTSVIKILLSPSLEYLRPTQATPNAAPVG